jgi:hypothetical protein
MSEEDERMNDIDDDDDDDVADLMDDSLLWRL